MLHRIGKHLVKTWRNRNENENLLRRFEGVGKYLERLGTIRKRIEKV